jgi:hypothetical protein
MRRFAARKVRQRTEIRAASGNTRDPMHALSDLRPRAILGAVLLGATLCAASGCYHRDAVPAPAAGLTVEEAEARRLAKQRRLEQRAAEAQASAAAPRSAIVMIALAWLGKLSGR